MRRRLFLKTTFARVAALFAAGFLGCKDAVTRRRIVLGSGVDFEQGVTFVDSKRVFLYKRAQGGVTEYSAVSAVCTHQSCLLQRAANEFRCPCHGARFDSRGQVLQGPAVEPLPWLKLALEDGQLVLLPDQRVDPSWVLRVAKS